MKKFNLLFILLVAIFMVSTEAYSQKTPKVKNVILMIGDGMGLSHIQAAMLSKASPLNMERAQYAGFAKTYSASSKVTDSAASATALSSGVKTYNGAIGVNSDKQPVETILEKAEKAGFATGLIATYCITNATPAAFIAHVDSRKKEEDIAVDFLKTDIDLFIGGGRDMFAKRADGKDLTKELAAKGYQMPTTIEEVLKINRGKVAGLVSDQHMKKATERGNDLPMATAQALNILKANNPKGFFIMVEGSMIDGGGHANDFNMLVSETIDFDNAVKEAFDFADKNPGTLVIITADHETGGLTLPAPEKKNELGVDPKFSTKGHTGIMTPVLSYGTGAAEFSGIMENTDIPKKIAKVMQIKW